MVEEWLNVEAISAFVSLTAMEVVLGIDNLVFISVLTGRLPKEQRRAVTRIGVAAALVLRIGMLFTLSWIMHLSTGLFRIGAHEVTWKHIILGAGGLFLMWKATQEIYEKVERRGHAHLEPGDGKAQMAKASGVIAQIVGIDLVFSIDSIATAVGMVDSVAIMVTAMLIAVAAMTAFASSIGGFVEKHPSMKILALSFLLLIGVLLVAEALGQHISKGYIYFAMGFSVGIELLNMRFRSRAQKAAKAAD